MPRGSGHPDLSQRPRREAPGMLTGVAILERDLGAAEYARHRIEDQLARRPPAGEARRLRGELRALDERRARTLRLLDEMNEALEARRDARGAAPDDVSG